MNVVLNVVWLVVAGIPLALGYVLAGLICFVLIVTIPWSVASFRVANYVLWPFGRTVVDKPSAGLGSALGNVIWILVAGIWLVLEHIAIAIALAVTIIGIPLAIANLKIIPVTLAPLGKQIVPSSQVFARW
ncbi:MAG: YccF domain-containing protein [Actinomycetota bacterium]|nr:YccF domain-containing protein [Actinomycetota bacterium]